jgi:hypothetical protein
MRRLSLVNVQALLLPLNREIERTRLKKKEALLSHRGDILFAVTEFLGTGSQVPLLLVIDAI